MASGSVYWTPDCSASRRPKLSISMTLACKSPTRCASCCTLCCTYMASRSWAWFIQTTCSGSKCLVFNLDCTKAPATADTLMPATIAATRITFKPNRDFFNLVKQESLCLGLFFNALVHDLVSPLTLLAVGLNKIPNSCYLQHNATCS